MTRIAAALVCLFAVAAWTPLALAEDEPDLDKWLDQLEQAVADRDAAQQRYDDALSEYQRMRHRKRMRGDAKAMVLSELQSAEAALPVAQQALDEAYEQARRAGVPPGLLRTKSPAAID